MLARLQRAQLLLLRESQCIARRSIWKELTVVQRTRLYHDGMKRRGGRNAKELAPRRSRKTDTATETQGEASQSTYLDIGLVHIGRLEESVTVP